MNQSKQMPTINAAASFGPHVLMLKPNQNISPSLCFFWVISDSKSVHANSVSVFTMIVLFVGRVTSWLEVRNAASSLSVPMLSALSRSCALTLTPTFSFASHCSCSSLTPETVEILRKGLEPAPVELLSVLSRWLPFFEAFPPPIVWSCVPAEGVRALWEDQVKPLFSPILPETTLTRWPSVGRQADIIPAADSTTHHIWAVILSARLKFRWGLDEPVANVAVMSDGSN